MSDPRSAACAVCPIGGHSAYHQVPCSTGLMTPDGAMTSGVMVVGEALGSAAEAHALKALVGPSGFLMARLMALRGWNRDDYRYANVLFCKPADSAIRDAAGRLLPSYAAAIAHCPFLDAEIDRAQPKAILALGDTAFTALTGEVLPMAQAAGYVFRERHGRAWVVPTYHPQFILRGNAPLSAFFLDDMAKARAIAEQGFAHDEPETLLDPSLPVWQDWVRDAKQRIASGVPLALDIETLASLSGDEDELRAGFGDIIDRASFAVSADAGVSLPWQTHYLVGVRELIDAAVATSKILIWNRPFDRPRIETSLGIVIPITATIDVMDEWHCLHNALPRKLGQASARLPQSGRLRPWKHLSMLEAAFYSAYDAIALWRNHDDLAKLLLASGQDRVYTAICAKLDPILEKMSRRGMLVDMAEREALRADLQGRLRAARNAMNDVVPLVLRKVKTWQKRGQAERGLAKLVQADAVLPGAVLHEVEGTCKQTTCVACGAHPVTKSHTTRKFAITGVDNV